MRSARTAAISILIFSSLMAVVACSRHPNDERISKDIQEKVAADPETKGSQVTVDAKDGKVTVIGKVKSPRAQQKVEEIARLEPGQVAVDNQTVIDPDMTASQQLRSEMAAATPPVQRPEPQAVVVPSGTVLTVRTSQALSSKGSQARQTFLAKLAQPISVEGRTALPKGATVSGTVVSAKAKGKVKGEAALSLALTSLSIEHHTYAIQTNVLSSTAKGKGKRTAATTGGGAAGGALIGGLAGGGKGAGIGALVGASAGFIGGAVTGNKQIELPAESALSFTLSAPLILPPPVD
jgi:BON domain-containing protein